MCLTIQYDVRHMDHGMARDMCFTVYDVTDSWGSWRGNRCVLWYITLMGITGRQYE